jgi:NADPH-dependent 2,4-dienoyl-CoA reductase/sulfur reductase-like enzyme
MADSVDIAVLGAGPAGMAAAVVAANAGLTVSVLDDQAVPGGQIWRNVEAVAARGDIGLFGDDYAAGVDAVAEFRATDVDYRPLSRVIGVESADEGGDVLYLRDGKAGRLHAKRLIIALGAYERPMPFLGWTLPGVMTAGAAQIALKTGGLLPERPFVLAGQGPLLLLLAAQFRAAGAAPDILLRLDDPGKKWSAGKHGLRALAGFSDLLKGLKWQRSLSDGVGETVAHVTHLEASGGGRLEAVRWQTADGTDGEAEATTLLVHDGVIPNAQLTRAMRIPHKYDVAAAAWCPEASADGQLADTGWAYVAGDNAGILGCAAATATGAKAGASAASALGAKTAPKNDVEGRLDRARAVRPLLDALYPPAQAFTAISDDTIICRCEAIEAGSVREALAMGAQGPNQLKAFLRTGMGPCQGRMCAYTVAALAAEANGTALADTNLMRLRMPISPVTVSEMSHLNETDMDLPTA